MQEYVKHSEVSQTMNHIIDPSIYVTIKYSGKKSQYFLDVFLLQTWPYHNFQTTFLADITYTLTIVGDMKAIVAYALEDLVFLSIAPP